MLKFFAIALGGACGALARYGVATLVSSRAGSRSLLGTFTINMTACFLIGFVLMFLAQRPGSSPMWRFLIPIGFIGAYSTFSTFEWEIFTTLENAAWLEASMYVLGSLVLGLLAVWLGATLARATV